MANKSIKELPKATQIQEDDALPMQQGATTKQVTGLTLTLWLLGMADGHGGVKDFEKLSESGLEKTYQFTMADTTKYTFTVTDGNGVADFQHSVSGLVHTYKLIMDNGQEYTMTIKDGEKGDKGDNAYLWYKFASEKPTSSSSSMGDEPDAWMGVHSGNEATAPTDPMDYTWVRVLGNTGPTGAPATLIRSTVEYQVGTSGTVVPSGNWSESIPAVPQGNYLWTRTTIQFNTGGIIQSYTNGRNGLDGLGSVVSVNNVSPGENGNVELTADDVGAVDKSGDTMEGPLHMNGQVLDGLNDPTEPDEAVRKAYADKKLALEGGTMEGPIHMNGHLLDGLNDPEQDDEAAQKAYVDKSVKAAAPINLFDNSDFINPVNQREVTNQSIPSQYFIDRWVFDRSNQDATYQVGGADGISFADGSWIFQRIPLTQAQMDNKVFTIAVWLADGTVWIQPVTFTAADSYSSAPWASQGIGTYFNNNNWRVTLANLPACTIRHIGLYEGEFTENTLPPYRPKGYAAELEICRRYYFRFAMLGLVGFVQSVNQAAFNISWLKMRLSNPTVNVLIPDNITAYGGIVVPVSPSGASCMNTILSLRLIGGESLQSFVPVTPFNTVVEITADL